MNQFDIRALLFRGYASFIPLDKMVFNGYRKALPSDSYSMLHIDVTLFPFCNELYCIHSNYPLAIILIAFSTTCVSIIAFVAESIIIYLTPNYWKKYLTKL